MVGGEKIVIYFAFATMALNVTRSMAFVLAWLVGKGNPAQLRVIIHSTVPDVRTYVNAKMAQNAIGWLSFFLA